MAALGAFFHTYSYLAVALYLLLLFALAWALYPSQRRCMLLSGFLSTPFSLANVILVPEYWSPKWIWAWHTGVEDMVFSFTTGGLAWIIAIRCMGNSLSLRPMFAWRRYLAGIVIGTVTAVILYLLGWNTMRSILGGMFSLGLFLLLRQRHLWPLVLGGGMLFLAGYLLHLKVIFAIWPGVMSTWSPATLTDMLWGLPQDELVWALGFGCTWPVFMAYIFNARLKLR